MGIEERQADANTLIEILGRQVFKAPPCLGRLMITSFGYETHIAPEIRNMLRYVRTPTTRHIRFAPDFFVIDRANKDSTYLLEIKATLTPLYSENRIKTISEKAEDPTLRWANIGQMEALAVDNYLALSNIGVQVAILNYCAYFDEQPLLCDFVERYPVIYRDRPSGDLASRGSGTPWVNFDTRSVRGLDAFLCEEHRLNRDAVASAIAAALGELNRRLPMRHHKSSPLYRK